MDAETLQTVVDEILPILEQKRIGKIFQLAANQFALDFRPGDGRYLFLNFEPSLVPRLYLIRRRVRELEKQSEPSGNFLLFARKRLADGQLIRVEKDAADRVVRFVFLVEGEAGTVQKLRLVAQLTGKAANLFLLDSDGRIIERLRQTTSDGQEIGQIYQPPQSDTAYQIAPKKTSLLEIVEKIELKLSDFPLTPAAPLSERLDEYFSKIEREREFEAEARRALNRLRQELNKKEKLRERLGGDLQTHGEPDSLKRRGDLLLANLYAARREGNLVYVVDYFDETAPEIAIEADANLSLQEVAEKFFARYAKARNAAHELTARIAALETEISSLKAHIFDLEQIVARRDETALSEFVEKNKIGARARQTAKTEKPKSKKEPEVGSGARRYRSSDGLEILVGRQAKDNDYLTFRVAKSLDWWMHAADYPGSHVIVRNPGKGELPPKTLLEAAELAAKFSQARQDAKVAVNYTQRKFVSKPKSAAPGLVRLASFRTILVEPKESGERILN